MDQIEKFLNRFHCEFFEKTITKGDRNKICVIVAPHLAAGAATEATIKECVAEFQSVSPIALAVEVDP